MGRRVVMLRFASLVLLASVVAASASASGKPVTVAIEVVTTTTDANTAGPPREPTTTRRSYRLSCDPLGGNLPLAASVCEDIHRFPVTMLDPPAPTPYPAKHECSGSLVASTTVSVVTAGNGSASRFADSQGCFTTHPPYDAALIYEAAIARDEATLAALEPGLRCATDPALLCVAELATAIREAIDRASQADAISHVAPFLGFPLSATKVGSYACTIPVGPVTFDQLRYGPTLSGRCSIDVQGLETRASKPTVVFTEEWPVGTHATSSHTWRVRLDGYAGRARIDSVTQAGQTPPQLRK
jgi:hypothetical protein